MTRARVRERLGQAAVVMGTAVLLSIASLPAISNATRGAVAGPACPSDIGRAVASAARSRTSAAAAVSVAGRVNELGHFAGRTLRIRTAQGTTVNRSLPAESFVGPALGGAVVYTQVTGGKSEVRVIDVATGCDMVIARPRGIVRSALLAPDGRAVYVHSVTGDRRDMGVSRHSLGWRRSHAVVPPLSDDARFGPTFGTQLALSADGATLAVQSCAAFLCRTRLADLDSGAISTYDEGHGALVGVTGSKLITFGLCPGLPCSVIATDRTTGEATVVADEAWSASLESRADGSALLSIETAAGPIEVLP